MNRREAIKWVMTAMAATALPGRGFAGEPAAASQGYGTDPNLVKACKPGDFWPLTLDEARRAQVAALCDVIIPADESGPAASAVEVPAFIDEWVSAPYPGHAADRRTLLEGLDWLSAESRRRFGREFPALDGGQQTTLCDEICDPSPAAPALRQAAAFFRRFRELTMAGYYTTPPGMRALGYVGNVPTLAFEGPTPAVLERLGLT